MHRIAAQLPGRIESIHRKSPFKKQVVRRGKVGGIQNTVIKIKTLSHTPADTPDIANLKLCHPSGVGIELPFKPEDPFILMLGTVRGQLCQRLGRRDANRDRYGTMPPYIRPQLPAIGDGILNGRYRKIYKRLVY